MSRQDFQKELSLGGSPTKRLTDALDAFDWGFVEGFDGHSEAGGDIDGALLLEALAPIGPILGQLFAHALGADVNAAEARDLFYRMALDVFEAHRGPE